MTKAQVDKAKEGPKKKAATVVMSTEDSNRYWADVDAQKKKTNVVVKVPKPKADSRAGLHWVGCCVGRCGCDVCVAKRKDPSETAMQSSKCLPMKSST